MSCNWPFHTDAACATCAKYELMYGATVDAWLETRQEVRQAAREQRAAQRQAGGAQPPADA